MTRALLEQALEALDSCTPGDYSTGHVIHPSYGEYSVNAAIEAIRAYLALPQGEPVAWMGEKAIYTSPEAASMCMDSAIPLYLHPQHGETEVQLILRSNFSDPLFERTVRQVLGVPA